MNGIIYIMTNNFSGKSYIGLTKNFSKRMNAHKHLSSKDEPKQYIHRAIKKYGWDNFSKIILRENIESREKLEIAEIFYISFYDTFYNGYNMTRGGENNIGYMYGKEHSDSIKKAFSIIEENGKTKGYNLAHNNLLNNRRSYGGEENPFYNKSHSEESKIKMRKPKANTENMKKSDETKRLMSKRAKEVYHSRGLTCCPHCDKSSTSLSIMKRWHFDKCKLKIREE